MTPRLGTLRCALLCLRVLFGWQWPTPNRPYHQQQLSTRCHPATVCCDPDHPHHGHAGHAPILRDLRFHPQGCPGCPAEEEERGPFAPAHVRPPSTHLLASSHSFNQLLSIMSVRLFLISQILELAMEGLTFYYSLLLLVYAELGRSNENSNLCLENRSLASPCPVL